MDYGKSGEPDSTLSDEGWDEIEIDFEDDLDIENMTPEPITVMARFKSGITQEWTFMVPKASEMYNGVITKESLLELIAAAYSVGESPYLILPLDNGTNVFFDLNATDYMEVR